jgi:4-amino-4-deoxy-L-arabinose transferase-like glycosyltransferase
MVAPQSTTATAPATAARETRWWLLAVLALSFAGKVALRLASSDYHSYWESGYSFYFQMAEYLLRDGQLYLGSSDTPANCFYAFRPPLYPLMIAAVCKLTSCSAGAFIVVEALISTVTVALVYGITRQLASGRAALLAAAGTAFFPYSFVHDTQLQETVLCNCLSTASIYTLVLALRGGRAWLLLTGLLFGAAALTRLSHLLPAVALTGLAFWLLRHDMRLAISACMLLGLGLAVCLVPWCVRNRVVAGEWSLSSEPGFALARAHNPHTFDYFPYRGSIDLSWQAFHTDLSDEERARFNPPAGDEFTRAARFREYAVSYVEEHPLEAVGRGLYKVAVNFLGVLSPLDGPAKNWSYFLSYWTLTLLALAGVRRLWRTAYLRAFGVLCACQALSSFVFWAHTSHRSFLDPLLAVVAGVGLERVLNGRWSAVKNKGGSDQARSEPHA